MLGLFPIISRTGQPHAEPIPSIEQTYPNHSEITTRRQNVRAFLDRYGGYLHKVAPLTKIVGSLLAWFSKNGRDLPWRRTTDPHAIWISEVMLQQTQVQTVIPYWERWMKRFPDVWTLAKAAPDEVLKLWEGLGYYTRARHLHRAAQIIVERYCGIFPRRYEDILELPGIGRYTAGAICSIACEQPSPILDGNVTRVLARVFGVKGAARSNLTQSRLWRASQDLIELAPAFRPAYTRPCAFLNQALMDLGAMTCTPRQPDCSSCPVAEHCLAFRTGRVALFPKPNPHPASTARHFAAFVLSVRGRFLVRQRGGNVVNAHLWEFPNVELNGESVDLEAAARTALGTNGHLRIAPLGTIRHSITRFRVRMDVYRVTGKRPANRTANGGSWRTAAELEELAFPSAHRKVIEALRRASERKRLTRRKSRMREPRRRR